MANVDLARDIILQLLITDLGKDRAMERANEITQALVCNFDILAKDPMCFCGHRESTCIGTTQMCVTKGNL